MYRPFLVVLFAIFVSAFGTAQVKLTWDDFADVSFEPEYNAVYDVNFLMPQFGDQIQAFKGVQVQIKGYFLDISGSGEIFLVSKNPMASCFFCGAAGPETIIEVRFKKTPPFKTDQIVTITGTLELNRDDVEHCNYILKEATGQLVN